MSPVPEASSNVRGARDGQHQQQQPQQQNQQNQQHESSTASPPSASLAPRPGSAQASDAPAAPPRTAATALSAEEARRARRRVSAEARKRIANACLQCKARKQKCSGERPQCNICKRRQAECIYVEQTPRPTKRQRRDTSTSNAARAARSTSPDNSALWGNALEVEGEGAGGAGSSSSAPHHRSAAGAAGGVGSGHRRGASIMSTTSAGYDGDVAASSTHGGGGVYSDNEEHEGVGGTSEEDDSKVEAPVDHKTRLLSDRHGRLSPSSAPPTANGMTGASASSSTPSSDAVEAAKSAKRERGRQLRCLLPHDDPELLADDGDGADWTVYIGETGSLSFLARVRKVVRETLGPSAFTLDSGQNSFADRPVIPEPDRIEGESVASSIPQNIPELLDLFFEHCNDIYYVLDREEADAIVASVTSGAKAEPMTGSSRRDLAILNAMCALGCFYTRDPMATAKNGERYFSTARKLMEDVFECADFWSVRLILLLALYLHFAAKRNTSFVYIGLAVRIAESLGIHQITRLDPMHSTPDTRRRRRMVFWTLYSLDRFCSYSLGRPFAINDETCTDPVLKLDEPLTGDRLLSTPCDPSQPAHIHLIHRLAAKVRLSVIIGHIVHRVYLRRSINRDIAEELSGELKVWWNNMPQCTSLHEGTKNPVVELHLAYLHAVMLLTRPFLAKVVEEYTVDYVKSRHSKKCQCTSRKGNVKRKILRYAGACVLVAERTVSLAHRMLKQNNLPRNDCGFVYHLFTAGLVLFFSSLPQLIHPNDPTQAESGASTKSQPLVVSLLADCASTDRITAYRYHEIMSRFLDAINDYRGRQATKTPTPPPQQNAQRSQPDLLDELQATSSGYFSGAPMGSALMTRESSAAGISRCVSPSAVAAHTLVQLPSGNASSNGGFNMNANGISSNNGNSNNNSDGTRVHHIPPSLPPASDLSQTPVGPYFMQHIHSQQHHGPSTSAADNPPPTSSSVDNTAYIDPDAGYYLSDFTTFFGWQQQHVVNSNTNGLSLTNSHSHSGGGGGGGGGGGAGSVTSGGGGGGWSGGEDESPNAASVTWEISWDETVSDFFTVQPQEEGALMGGMGLGMGM